MADECWVLECDMGVTKFLVPVDADDAKEMLPDWRVVYRADSYEDAQQFIADVEGDKKPK